MPIKPRINGVQAVALIVAVVLEIGRSSPAQLLKARLMFYSIHGESIRDLMAMTERWNLREIAVFMHGRVDYW